MYRIGIIGVGLIGGSYALRLKEIGFASKVYGYDKSEKHCKIAKQRHIVDDILPLKTLIQSSEIIIISTPVNIVIQIIGSILDEVSTQVVFDVSSVKTLLSNKMDKHSNRRRLVSTHPMWGTENSGPEYATTDSFDNKRVILCDSEKSDKDAMEVVQQLHSKIGMDIVFMSSKDHDQHAAYVSHISHITSFVLSLAVLDKEKEENNILTMASGGFESTVRLAKSSSSMWSHIFIQNKKWILKVVEEYKHFLLEFGNAIKNNDLQKIDNLIEQANKIRKILDK